MNFQQAVRSGFRHYLNFDGRATRSEFWWWILFGFILITFLGWMDSMLFPVNEEVIDAMVGASHVSVTSFEYMPYLSSTMQLLLFLPSLSMMIRRLHDGGRSGFWLLLIVVPLIGHIVLLVFFLTGSQRGENIYGADPLA